MISGGLRPFRTKVKNEMHCLMQFAYFPLCCLLAGMICIMALLPVSGTIQAAEPAKITISSDQQFAYAQDRYLKKDFRTAEVEFKRFVHFFPQDPRAAEAAFKTGMALLHQELFHEAARQFNEIIRNDPDLSSPYTREAFFMQSRAFIHLENMGYARVVLENFLQLTQDPSTRDRIHLALARLHIRTTRQPGTDALDQALANLEKISPESDLETEKKDLTARIRATESIPKKNPFLAGLLAVIPGGGYLYTGRIHDAAAAFFLNTGLGLAAWKAFDQENYALGGIVTFVGTGFYSGSIYGSISAAHKHNHAQKIRILDRTFSINTGFGAHKNGVFFSLNQEF